MSLPNYFNQYLFALRHKIQQTTTRTRRNRQIADMVHKAICTGSPGSHQNSVDGGKVGKKTPHSGLYCVQKTLSVCL